MSHTERSRQGKGHHGPEDQNVQATDRAVRKLVREGRELFRLGRFQDALSSFLGALELEEFNIYALVGAGDGYRQIKDFASAVVHYEKALSREPSNPFALV
ncbi:MAG: tetratricopeptide repeat protein [Thermodesulfobacteriota bacterium]